MLAGDSDLDSTGDSDLASADSGLVSALGEPFGFGSFDDSSGEAGGASADGLSVEVSDSEVSAGAGTSAGFVEADSLGAGLLRTGLFGAVFSIAGLAAVATGATEAVRSSGIDGR